MRVRARNLLIWPVLLPAVAHAEPGASLGHIPWLWGFSALLALGVAWLPTAVGKHLGSTRSKRFLLGLGLALAAAFLVFVAPMIVVLGSILVTGRTM